MKSTELTVTPMHSRFNSTRTLVFFFISRVQPFLFGASSNNSNSIVYTIHSS